MAPRDGGADQRTAGVVVPKSRPRGRAGGNKGRRNALVHPQPLR